MNSMLLDFISSSQSFCELCAVVCVGLSKLTIMNSNQVFHSSPGSRALFVQRTDSRAWKLSSGLMFSSQFLVSCSWRDDAWLRIVSMRGSFCYTLKGRDCLFFSERFSFKMVEFGFVPSFFVREKWKNEFKKERELFKKFSLFAVEQKMKNQYYFGGNLG